MPNKNLKPMPDKNPKSKSRKSLGQDPFADLAGLEQAEEENEENEEKIEATTAEEAAEGSAISSPPLPTEPTPFKDSLEVEVLIDEIGEFDEFDEFDEFSEFNEIYAATETEDQIREIEAEIIASASEPETDQTATPPDEAQFNDPNNPKSNKRKIPKSEAVSHLLDELIATIDQKMEAVVDSEGAATSYLGTAVPTDAAGRQEQHVIFSLAGSEYAVPIVNITEIRRPQNVTPLPNVPDWVLGVANQRGDIISMVDLRAFLGLAQTSYGQNGRMLVAQTDQADAPLTMGLIVDRVSGIRHLATERISDPTAPIADQVAPYLRGVYDYEGHLLIVLDFDQLLLSSDMQQFQPV